MWTSVAKEIRQFTRDLRTLAMLVVSLELPPDVLDSAANVDVSKVSAVVVRPPAQHVASHLPASFQRRE